MCVLALFFPAAEVVPVAETDPNKKMTILINVEQPDIILVEAMDDINCLALILNVRIDFHEVDRILSHFNDFVVFFLVVVVIDANAIARTNARREASDRRRNR